MNHRPVWQPLFIIFPWLFIVLPQQALGLSSATDLTSLSHRWPRLPADRQTGRLGSPLPGSHSHAHLPWPPFTWLLACLGDRVLSHRGQASPLWTGSHYFLFPLEETWSLPRVTPASCCLLLLHQAYEREESSPADWPSDPVLHPHFLPAEAFPSKLPPQLLAPEPLRNEDFTPWQGTVDFMAPEMLWRPPMLFWSINLNTFLRSSSFSESFLDAHLQVSQSLWFSVIFPRNSPNFPGHHSVFPCLSLLPPSQHCSIQAFNG